MQDSFVLTVHCASGIAQLGGLSLPCRLGRKGFIAGDKGAEGDEKTPLGTYRLRWGFYRADKLPRPKMHTERPLTWREIKPEDGWCDDVQDPAYNRLIKRPYAASHEPLWRADGAYDIILVMSHNDSPPVKGDGSAVFIHVAQADDRQTLGCIAFAPEDMVQLLPKLHAHMTINIQP